MTVEETTLPLPVNEQQRPVSSQSREHSKNLETIKEITNIHDIRKIEVAIQSCHDANGAYDVNEVISCLMAEKENECKTLVPVPNSKAVGTEATFIGPRNKPGTEPVIDLTNETSENEQLQKAIAESLRDTPGPGILGGQISREDQEISRVLEQSLDMDNKSGGGTKRKRGDIWFTDPLNPRDQVRENDKWPVGLRNVGNTCWFSAVIQSLFHLPLFRKLVLNFNLPADAEKESYMERRNLRFMKELRLLFALMQDSKRKYVDPSKAIDILREAFTSGGANASDNQQDVSEFQHKLLEWLEDAFRTETPPSSPDGASGPSSPPAKSSPSSEKQQDNPVVQLFYGQYLAEGVNEDVSFSNKETFGQFPVQIEGYKDLHDSLEAATAQGEIETVSTEVKSKSRQEEWFTRLPPVLTLELARFQYNSKVGRPEKIHEKVAFQQVIYMDRYLEKNRAAIKRKREEVKKLKEDLVHLQNRLDKYVNYGSGPKEKRFPLQDVLEHALDFAQSKSNPPTEDVEMASPKPALGGGDSPSKSYSQSTDVAMKSPKSSKRAPIERPSPKHVTSDELNVLQSCLRRWRCEVEADVKELQESISSLEECINTMYSGDDFTKYPYQLHAVLVHGGQAASGHYWAYVYSNVYKKWLKFNDITVTESSWEELSQDSFGGHHNATAYCLMYIDANRKDLLEECIDNETGQPEPMPIDLQKYVNEDTHRLQQEIEEWDKKQEELKVQQAVEPSQEQTQAGPSSVVTSQSTQTNRGASTSQPQPSRQTTQSSQTSASVQQTLAWHHAQISSKDISNEVTSVLESFRNKGTLAVLKEVVQRELKRCETLRNMLSQDLPRVDHRLQSVLVFVSANRKQHQNIGILHCILFEQFAYMRRLDADPDAKALREAALDEVEKKKRTFAQADKELYSGWHKDYSTYRNTVKMFILGAEAYHDEKYIESLPYLVSAYEMNNELVQNDCSLRGLDHRVLAFYRRKCLTEVNELAATEFLSNNDDVGGDPLSVMFSHVLPCLTRLVQSWLEEDAAVVEEIRGKWCLFLNEPLEKEKIDKLQDLFSKLFEPAMDARPQYSPNLNAFKDSEALLAERYKTVMGLASKQGYISEAVGYKK